MIFGIFINRENVRQAKGFMVTKTRLHFELAAAENKFNILFGHVLEPFSDTFALLKIFEHPFAGSHLVYM